MVRCTVYVIRLLIPAITVNSSNHICHTIFCEFERDDPNGDDTFEDESPEEDEEL